MVPGKMRSFLECHCEFEKAGFDWMVDGVGMVVTSCIKINVWETYIGLTIIVANIV